MSTGMGLVQSKTSTQNGEQRYKHTNTQTHGCSLHTNINTYIYVHRISHIFANKATNVFCENNKMKANIRQINLW